MEAATSGAMDGAVGDTWVRCADAAPCINTTHVSRRVFIALSIPILLGISPFLNHHSQHPVLWGFSTHYLLFLLGLVIGGLGLALALARSVRRVPRHRQLRIAYLLFGLLVLVPVTGECLLGYLGRDLFAKGRLWGQMLSPFMGYENVPNHRWTRVGATYTTDASTLRHHPTPRPAADDETLIVVLGGSSAFGYGLDDDETWPQQLETNLRNRLGPHVTVLNAGNNGHNTLQQFFRLYIRVLPLNPDIVLHYGAINDVRPQREKNRLTRLPRGLPDVSSSREFVRMANRGQGFYFENSLLIARAKTALELAYKKLTSHGLPVDLWKLPVEAYVETADLYVQNLDAMSLLCQSRGVRFVPITFIAAFDGMPQSLDIGTPYFVQRMKMHFRAGDGTLIDLKPALEAIEEPANLFFPDLYHPNERGAAFIANHVADMLVPIIAEQETKRRNAQGKQHVAQRPLPRRIAANQYRDR